MIPPLILHILFFPRTPASISTQKHQAYDQLAKMFIHGFFKVVNWMLLRNKCQTHKLIHSGFSRASLPRHYCIHHLTDSVPCLVHLPSSLQTLQFPPFGISLCHFQCSLHLQSFFPPIPISPPSPAEFSRFLLVSWRLSHYSHLFARYLSSISPQSWLILSFICRWIP